MPRNITGGSGHRAQRNSESSKEKKNRGLVDSLLDDFSNGEIPAGVFIGRVLKRMGNGRMDVLYMDESFALRQKIVPLRGGLTGKGKKDVWVDVESIVMIHETGLGNASHEIVAVFSDAQVRSIKKIRPELENSRLFAKSDAPVQDEGFEFEHEETVTVPQEAKPYPAPAPAVPKKLKSEDELFEVDIDAI